MRSIVLWIAVLVGVAPPRQSHVKRVLVVAVADSAGLPLSGAEVSVRRDLNTALSRAMTDLAGRAVITLAASQPPSVELVVRKIGFQPERRFLDIATVDSLDVRIVLKRALTVLPTVRVDAEASERRKRLFVDADAIEHSPRRLDDAVDIVRKLRPDMVFGLGGRGFCPPDSDIWVNGRRILWQTVLPADVAIQRTSQLGLPWWVVSVLSRIRPEHIQEMTYHDCMDMSVGKPGSDRAIFVILKPGVAFDSNRGSYVLERRATNRAGRVLGLFDADSGNPIVGAKVVDVESGTSANTTTTGTVVLGFAASPVAHLRIEASGYETVYLSVSNTGKDTVPVTAVISRLKRLPP